MPLALDAQNAALRTAMTSPQHLKKFLEASDRRFLVLNAPHLVDALPWPAGVELVQQVVSAYRDHRRVIPCEVPGPPLPAPLFLGETLSVAEIDACIEQLQEARRTELERIAALRRASS
jgi:hypothetical protein